jgi:hypothetical protein
MRNVLCKAMVLLRLLLLEDCFCRERKDVPCSPFCKLGGTTVLLCSQLQSRLFCCITITLGKMKECNDCVMFVVSYFERVVPCAVATRCSPLHAAAPNTVERVDVCLLYEYYHTHWGGPWLDCRQLDPSTCTHWFYRGLCKYSMQSSWIGMSN